MHHRIIIQPLTPNNMNIFIFKCLAKLPFEHIQYQKVWTFLNSKMVIRLYTSYSGTQTQTQTETEAFKKTHMSIASRGYGHVVLKNGVRVNVCGSKKAWLPCMLSRDDKAHTQARESILALRECSHISKFSPIQNIGPLLFSIVSMVTGWITGWMGLSPIIGWIMGQYFWLKKPD